MRGLGSVLIAVGFLVGAYHASLDPTEVQWPSFALGIAPGVVGVALRRIARRLEAGRTDLRHASLERLRESLGTLSTESERLWGERDRIDVYDLRHWIDEHFRVALSEFAEEREALIDVHGLQAYADVMTQFAAGERYLNRVWSASTDGYIDEAHAYLEKAKDQFEHTRQAFEGLVATR